MRSWRLPHFPSGSTFTKSRTLAHESRRDGGAWGELWGIGYRRKGIPKRSRHGPSYWDVPPSQASPDPAQVAMTFPSLLDKAELRMVRPNRHRGTSNHHEMRAPARLAGKMDGDGAWSVSLHGWRSGEESCRELVEKTVPGDSPQASPVIAWAAPGSSHDSDLCGGKLRCEAGHGGRNWGTAVLRPEVEAVLCHRQARGGKQA